MNLKDVYEQLIAPFPPEAIDLKPGATSSDKTKALALAYADPRAYQDRLDSVVGPDSWAVQYRPLGTNAMICRLTILGVVREDVGESDTSDPNAATVAVAQAFKRACAAFGIGRYLYHLPQLWVQAEAHGKSIKIVDPAGTVRRMYQMAGITLATVQSNTNRALLEEELRERRRQLDDMGVAPALLTQPMVVAMSLAELGEELRLTEAQIEQAQRKEAA